MSELPDIGQIVNDHKAKRSRVYPHPNNRASELGHDCERYLVLARTSWREKKPPEPTLQCIFDLGNVIERAVISDLASAGVEFVEQQRSFEDKRLQLTGHIDGMVRVGQRTYPAEIKGLAHHSWESLNEFSDFFAARQPWVRKYPAQLTIYEYLSDKEWGCFLLFSKQTGQLKCIWIPLDLEYAESLLQKVERVNTHVAAKTMPEQIDDPEQCVDCDFFHICLPEIKRDAIDLSSDPKLEEWLERREALSEAAADYRALDKAVKKALEGQRKVLVGNFMVTGNWIERKGYVVEDGQYWRTKIVRLKED